MGFGFKVRKGRGDSGVHKNGSGFKKFKRKKGGRREWTRRLLGRLRGMAFSSEQAGKVREAYMELFSKYIQRREEEGKFSFKEEFGKMAKEKFGTSGEELLTTAIKQLESLKPEKLPLTPEGRIDTSELPQELQELKEVVEFIHSIVGVWIIVSSEQIEQSRTPFPINIEQKFIPVVENGGAATIVMLKTLPEEIKEEIRRITENDFNGINWITDEGLRGKIQTTNRWKETQIPKILEFIRTGTIRVLAVGRKSGERNESLVETIREINSDLESRYGNEEGYEQRYVERLLRSLRENEKIEALLEALKVGGAVIVSVKVIEHILPHLMHSIGGMLDDLFGAIIPDVSQSVSHVKTFTGKIRKGLPVLMSGAVALPASFFFGWMSSVLYSDGSSLEHRILAGLSFALACSIGTVGTSISALVKTYKAYKKLEEENIRKATGFFRKIKDSFNEAILSVPFRIGHTVIAFPIQIGLGILAGAFKFFDSSYFVISEGIAETVIGAIVAFSYTPIINYLFMKKLKREKGRNSGNDGDN